MLTVKEAAEILGLSERQTKRLKKKVAEEGAAGLIHKNALKTPKNRISDEMQEEIIKLKREEVYTNCNFNHFREILAEHHEVNVSYSTLYRILKAAGIGSPHTRRRLKPHRRRKRRTREGMLLQVDATPYAWFKGDSTQYALHGGIDDATGQITGLYMTKNECLQGYFGMLERTILNYGVPVSLYADRHTIFQSPNKSKADIDPKVLVNDTQFGRCLKELGIQLIAARSPQAKGRIERLWETLQDRLPIEFALRGITSLEAANEFLNSYIYAFNSGFAVEPEEKVSLFSKLPEGLNLNYVLCVKETRSVDAGGVFSYAGKRLKVVESSCSRLLPLRAKITVLVSPKFGIKAEYRKILYDVEPFLPSKRAPQAPQKPLQPRVHPPVPDSHPYKRGKHSVPYIETDAEIMDMLHDIFFEKFT